MTNREKEMWKSFMHLSPKNILLAKKISGHYVKILEILESNKDKKMERALANLAIAVKFCIDAIEDSSEKSKQAKAFTL